MPMTTSKLVWSYKKGNLAEAASAQVPQVSCLAQTELPVSEEMNEQQSRLLKISFLMLEGQLDLSRDEPRSSAKQLIPLTVAVP